MIVQLGVTTSVNNKINKDFTFIKECNCTIRGSIVLENPRLLLSYDADIVSCNYMYIPEWSRYYFIDSITMVTGTMMEVHGEVDVLMSHAQHIASLSVYASRVENKESPFLVDSNMGAEVAGNILVENIASPFFPSSEWPSAAYCYLFTVLGGSDNSNTGNST